MKLRFFILFPYWNKSPYISRKQSFSRFRFFSFKNLNSWKTAKNIIKMLNKNDFKKCHMQLLRISLFNLWKYDVNRLLLLHVCTVHIMHTYCTMHNIIPKSSNFLSCSTFLFSTYNIMCSIYCIFTFDIIYLLYWTYSIEKSNTTFLILDMPKQYSVQELNYTTSQYLSDIK